MDTKHRRSIRGRFVRVLLIVAVLVGGAALPPQAAHSQSSTYFVATNGSDSGGGSEANPWKTISHAITKVPDGSLILVKPGVYTGEVRLTRVFSQGVVIRSQVPYMAQLRNNKQVVASYSSLAKVTLEGFDISHTGPGAGALLINLNSLGETGRVRDVTILNNIIHDSYNNDLMKFSHGAQRISVVGNIFYNQEGYDEHIDVNGAVDSVIQDNIFFNDFEGSGRSNNNDTASFIVIKDSNGADDSVVGSRNIVIRRNIFLNWQGHRASSFLLLGEDGFNFYEAQNILAENNLFLGNTANPMLSPFGAQGARDVTFRNNTVSGNLPSAAFAMMLRAVGSNPNNANVRFYNNLWSDPTGTMNDFSDTVRGDTSGYEISHNLYFNGGRSIPANSDDLINVGDDRSRVVADPGLPGLNGLTPPRWDARSGRFAGGFSSIREAFVSIARTYGTPKAGGPVLNAGNSGSAPDHDLLGRARQGAPDIGALEAQNYLNIGIHPTENSVLVTWETGGELPAGATWRVTHNGRGDPASPIAGLSADTRSLRLDGLRMYEVFSVQVSAEANGQTLLSASAPAFATDRYVFIPTVNR